MTGSSSVLPWLHDERREPFVSSLSAHAEHLAHVRPAVPSFDSAADEKHELVISLVSKVTHEAEAVRVLAVAA